MKTIFVILLISMFFLFLPLLSAQTNIGTAEIKWNLTEIKNSALEKYLFYNLTWKKENSNLSISVYVNSTVYQFLKDAYQNPTQAKCNIIKEYIADDYPLATCQQIQDILEDYITKGWKFYQNGLEKGIIEVIGNNVEITISDIKKLDRIQLGRHTIIYEYQEENKINYVFDWGETNLTLYKLSNTYVEENKTIENYSILDDIYVYWSIDKWKFGANDTSLAENETAKYMYILNSTKSLIHLNKGNYPLLYNFGANPENDWKEFRHYYDFEDICNKTYSDCNWIWHNFVNETDETDYDYSLELFFNSTNKIDPAIENISACRTLNESDYEYNLSESIQVFSGDCIIVTGMNVTFDLANLEIVYNDTDNTDVGIYGSGDYLTIANGNLSRFGFGIYINKGYNNTAILNVSINQSKYGIFFDYQNIGISSLKNIVLFNNSYGLFFSNVSGLNLSEIYSENNTYGVYFNISKNNLISSSTFLDNYLGIYFYGSSNNNITDTIINNSLDNDTSLITDPFGIVPTYRLSTNNILLNVTYSTLDIENYNSLIRKWYFNTNISLNDSGNPSFVITNANLSLNSTTDVLFSGISDENGIVELNMVELEDYTNYGGTITYKEYSIDVEHSNYNPYETTFQIHDNTYNFTSLLMTPLPGQQMGSPSIDTTYTYVNYTDTNISLNICGNKLCEQGESFYDCPIDCGGLNIDDLIFTCFAGTKIGKFFNVTDTPQEKAKCIINQSPLVFWIGVGIIVLFLILSISKKTKNTKITYYFKPKSRKRKWRRKWY
mgnify:CR=1 FL=1